MAKKIIDLGNTPNDNKGDSLRVGGGKINDNFTELYNSKEALEDEVSLKTNSGGYTGTSQDLKDEIDNASFTGLTTYQTLSELEAVSPIPDEGTPAKVANDPDPSNNGYYSVVSGVWVKDAGVFLTMVDNEDIEGDGDSLLIADRASDINGKKGYKIIRPGFDFTSIPANYADSIWEIRYAFDLQGVTFNVPEGVTLKFTGGVLKNAVIVGDFTSVESGSVKVFEDVTLVGDWNVDKFFATWFGALGDGSFDNSDVLNNVLKFNFELNLFLPMGNYVISKPLEILTTPKGLFGQLESNRPETWISTTENYSHKSMLRNWTDSDYGVGETDPDLVPNVISNIVRYHQISNLRFYIENDNETTAIDLCSAQESAILRGLIFTGFGLSKGFAVRIRTNTSNEGSFNGCVIRDVVVYRSGWKGELFAKGKGSDLHVENWVTSPTDHSDTPFQIDIIDSTFLNLHCEAYCSATGRVFHISGHDCSITQSFFIYQQVLEDIFYCDNSAAPSGFGRMGVSLSDVKLYPHAGAPLDASNMNLVNDVSQSSSSVAKMSYRGLNNLSFIKHYSYKRLEAIDGVGVKIEISANNGFKTIENYTITPASGLQIDYVLLSKNHGGIVTLTGRNSSDSKIVFARFFIGMGDNLGGFSREFGVLIDKHNYADDLVLEYDSMSGIYSITTTGADIYNARLSISGNLDFNSFI